MIMLHYKSSIFFQLHAQTSFCKQTKQGKSNAEPGNIMAPLSGIAVVSLRYQRARGTERQLPARKQQKQQQ